MYNKDEVKEILSTDMIFDLLVEWGGEPEYTNTGFVSSTICHNAPGEGSRKLYYYFNTGLFKCYTGCDDFFDIFELVCKVADIQWGKIFDLNDAVQWIAARFGMAPSRTEYSTTTLPDWDVLDRYSSFAPLKEKTLIIPQPKDANILNHLHYNVKLTPWLDEGISQEVLTKAQIGYYPKDQQITIPHFDSNNNFIGLRGRTLIQEEAERYGKYRPLRVKRILYNHPLGSNLYGLNWNKNNIAIMKKAIIFESEKSVLKYASAFGWENNISVACCGSSISTQQMSLLLQLGITEVIIAFDRQFVTLGDEEYNHLKKNLLKIGNKYHSFLNVTCIFDTQRITGYKDSPIDKGGAIFYELYKKRQSI